MNLIDMIIIALIVLLIASIIILLKTLRKAGKKQEKKITIVNEEKKITPEKIHSTLIEIDPSKYFYLQNGDVLRDLKDLKYSFDNISEETFRFHVNEAKNDFANWVLYVFEEKELAEKLANCMTKQQFKSVLDLLVLG